MTTLTTRTLEKIAAVLLVAVLGVALAVQVRALPALPLVVALVITVSAGLDLVLRGEARYRPTPDLSILPAALVVGAVLFLPLLASGTSIVVGLAILGGLLFTVFWAEHSLRLGLIPPRTGETALAVIGYAAAFVLYTAIYQSKTRSLISAPAIVLVTFLLAARQLRLGHDPPDPPEPARTAAPSGTAGLRPPTGPNGAAPTSGGAAASPPGASAVPARQRPTADAPARAAAGRPRGRALPRPTRPTASASPSSMRTMPTLSASAPISSTGNAETLPVSMNNSAKTLPRRRSSVASATSVCAGMVTRANSTPSESVMALTSP